MCPTLHHNTFCKECSANPELTKKQEIKTGCEVVCQKFLIKLLCSVSGVLKSAHQEEKKKLP